MKKTIVATLIALSFSSIASADCFKNLGQGPSDIMNIINSNLSSRDYSSCSAQELEFAKIRLGGYISKKQAQFKELRKVAPSYKALEQHQITSDITAAKVALMQVEAKMGY